MDDLLISIQYYLKPYLGSCYLRRKYGLLTADFHVLEHILHQNLRVLLGLAQNLAATSLDLLYLLPMLLETWEFLAGGVEDVPLARHLGYFGCKAVQLLHTQIVPVVLHFRIRHCYYVDTN